MRTLFNQPIRKETTELFYPDKITLQEFGQLLSVDAFVKNLETLIDPNDTMYPEQWAETFLAWHEIEVE